MAKLGIRAIALAHRASSEPGRLMPEPVLDFAQQRLPEQNRAFLQRRLAVFGRVSFLFSASFFLVSSVSNSLNAQLSLRQLALLWSNWFHACLVLIFLAIWLVCRKGRHSITRLAVIDVVGTTLACLACAVTAWSADHPGNLKYRMLLEITSILICRATVVPSSAHRTFGTSVMAVPPVAHAAYLFERAAAALAAQHGDGLAAARSGAFAPGVSPIFAVVEATLYSLLAVAVATLTSHIIYGLRRQIREAQNLGQYTLREKLGEGGMGVVYRATHGLLRRPTAIKLLPLEKAGQASIKRFEREVQLTSQLTHPNTVSIYDYGHTPDGIFYYAMEFLDGLTLEQLVRADGPQHPARVVHILRQVCDALTEAHDMGLVHRDIKPANIILCQRGGQSDIVKVLDFGLVKNLDGDSPTSRNNVIAGTPAYLSPEAIQYPDLVEARSDLYAVGAVGYYLVTGRDVFPAQTLVEMLGQHLNTVPTAPSVRLQRAVPAELEALILGCLEKEIAARPASASALSEALVGCTEPRVWGAADARAWWADRGPSAKATPAATGLGDSKASTLVMPGRAAPRPAAPEQ